MGTICATPTAGSAGVVPGTLFAVKNKLNPTREQMIGFLFTSGAFGFVVANNASFLVQQAVVRQKLDQLQGWQLLRLLKWQAVPRSNVQKHWRLH